MFDDILGKRPAEEIPQMEKTRPASVHGVESPDKMDPDKKPAMPNTIGGVKGRPIHHGNVPTPVEEDDEPELSLDLDFDEGEDDCDDCDDCDCGIDPLGDVGCLDEDEDVWSQDDEDAWSAA